MQDTEQKEYLTRSKSKTVKSTKQQIETSAASTLENTAGSSNKETKNEVLLQSGKNTIEAEEIKENLEASTSKSILSGSSGEREKEAFSQSDVNDLGTEQNKENFEEGSIEGKRMSELNDLIKLLTLKFGGEEAQQAAISAENIDNVIPEFNGKSPTRIEDWFHNFETCALAYKWNENQKYVFARKRMTNTAKLFVETLNVYDYASLKTAMENEFRREFVSADVHRQLQERKKKSSETMHEYILHMRRLGVCGKIDEKSVIRYIVDGVNEKIENKVLFYSAQNFNELKARLETYETIIDSKSKQNGKENGKYNKKGKIEHCYNCGSVEHRRSECKEKTKCFRCNKTGHISKNCQEKSQKMENDVNSVNSVNSVEKRQKMLKMIKMCDRNVQCLVDSGAEVSLIEAKIAKKLNLSLQACTNVVTGLGNTKTKAIGEIEVELKVDNLCCSHKFVVIPDNLSKYEVILGFDYIGKCKYTYDETGYKNEIETLIHDYKPNLNAISPIHMKICIAEEKIIRQTLRRMPLSHQEVVSAQVDNWLQNGIIRPSNSEYCSPVVVVGKKDGTKRVCIDFRELNKIVQKDIFPVPLMEEVIETLEGARIFSTLDLENAFFHVPIEENSKKFTAFITRDGIFEFNRAPFGFCNSPAVFLRFVNHIFRNLVRERIMQIYMDDVIIYSVDEEEGIKKLKTVLEVAENYGLKIKWAKCKFLQNEVVYLGLHIKDGCISPDEGKCQAIKNFPVPKTIKKLQSFLGLTGYFRKFVRNYAVITKPLTDLLRKEASFNMGPAQLESTNLLKAILTEKPVLRVFSPTAETELHTDACKDGFGAILLQKFENNWHPVYYWSKKATTDEGKLHSFYLEIKAAYLAVQRLRHYLLGKKFKLVTDCQAFKYATNKSDLAPPVARWILCMQDYNYAIEHRKGTSLKHVDALSRSPVNVMTISSEICSRLRKSQADDNHFKAIRTILSTQPYEDYIVKNDVLFKNRNGLMLLAVPKDMEFEIIKTEHEKGHFAAEKTLNAIEQQYFIPHLRQKIEKVIRNCIKCILFNKKLGKQEGLLHVIDKGDAPLLTLHMDHLGPMDATTKKYKYILALIDGFTKFVWLYPTKTTSAEEVMKKLEEWTAVFGAPRRIISDKGAAFMSKALEEWCQAEAVEHSLTTTGVARGNGQVERLNRIILNVISKLSADRPEMWYKYVNKVQKVVNNTVSKTTKRTPFELMFGVKMRTELDININEMAEMELATIFMQERDDIRAEAKGEIAKAQDEYKKQYDKNRKKETTYKIGDLVAIKRTQFVAGKKLASGYLGPYEVTQCKRNGRYNVRKAADFEGPMVTSTSCDFMKQWRQEDSYLSGTDEEVE